jgi:hypothetical protein
MIGDVLSGSGFFSIPDPGVKKKPESRIRNTGYGTGTSVRELTKKTVGAT